jgi:hypothetical protein
LNDPPGSKTKFSKIPSFFKTDGSRPFSVQPQASVLALGALGLRFQFLWRRVLHSLRHR